MDVESLKQDVVAGKVDVDRLIGLIDKLSKKLDAANRRIEELEKQLGGSTIKRDEPFSVESEEKRQEARGKKSKRKKPKGKRKGRVSTAEKLARATREQNVYPDGIDPDQCKLSHSRVVWRLENGQAVLVAYHIYRSGNQYGKIRGVVGRSEFSREIFVAIAYLVFIMGLSFDKVCALMNFFQNLKLSKSQADALMNQLSREWESEFETLCTLLANEVFRLMLQQQLFTFVTADDVEQPNGKTIKVSGTNNEAERTLRNPTGARDTGRTSKTKRGTRRRTITQSVLESLRVYLPEFTLSSVITEINRWQDCGMSCFTQLLIQLNLPPPEGSVLDSVFSADVPA